MIISNVSAYDIKQVSYTLSICEWMYSYQNGVCT